MMKKIIVLIGMLITIGLAYSPFHYGFVDGYKAGFCYGVTYCMSGFVPMTPMPGMGETTYMQGYNKGFLLGLSKRDK